MGTRLALPTLTPRSRATNVGMLHNESASLLVLIGRHWKLTLLFRCHSDDDGQINSWSSHTRSFRIDWIDFAFFEGLDLPELLRATAWRTSALKADSSTSSPSWMSIARRAFPSRLELKRRAGSFRDAPLAKVSFTTFL